MKNANTVFDEGSKIEFKTIDEMTSVWKNWIECLLLKGY